MASSEADSQSQSPLSLLLSPSLDKIIKNGSWRKHAKLVNECRAVLDRIADNNSPSAAADDGSEPDDVPGVLRDGSTDRPYSLSDCEYILGPLIAACASGFPKIADPAVDCVQKLIAHGFVCGEADAKGGPGGKLLWRLLEAVCGCHDSGDDNVELLVLKTLLSAVTSIPLRVHGDCLLMVVRACYDLYLASKNAVNQATAKATLIQMLVIVFRRMEADSSTVPIHPIVVAELMEPAGMADGAGDDSGMIQFVQGFITKIMQDIDGVLNPAATPRKGPMVANHDGGGGGGGGLFETTTVAATNPADLLDSTDKDMLDAKYWEISMYKTALEGRKGELEDGGDGERDGGGGGGHDDSEVQIGNKLRRDAFLVFRALCKLSMRTPPKEASADHQSMRAKIVALELLKILLENAGAIFRTSERFLGAIKQYLCLSLLKNSASTVMIVFQLSCSIFISLVSRFRAGLKAEIGVFFPMLVLRVLENVAQPNFQQKMIVLRFLQKLCVDSQILVDIFLNYDCDVNSSNIFERMVNGLLKTAQGVPSSTTTSRLPLQDVAMKLEAMKCLVAVLRSMGDWMNKQLRIPDAHYSRKSEVAESSPDPGSHPTENGNRDEFVEASDSHSEVPSEISDVSTIKQGRAYKLELQEGISLFNENPMKGIDFLINANKVGNSPEEVAAFLKSASGLNKTSIGDYLGEGGELCVRVMHAYVDSYDFQDMDFDEAMRSFLQGFRLPGEAQKIDLIMEKFAESYCKCNPKAFTSTDTAYVLAYSVIMLNTDSHNPMVKHKMSADDFIQNNRGIDDGKDVSEEYLRSIFDRISRNEIIVKENDKDQLQKQSMNSNGIIGLESILNIVIHKQWDDKHMETSDDLIRHMQEQFKERTLKSESVYYAATDVVILKFMIEACWAPMLAAFSVPLDQSDDKLMITQCLNGFRHAIHVTAVMRMKTQRDAFLTSLAKFTFLHSPADIKQKNINAIKVLFAIADEDGNYLQEAWEHILTCVSRFENLHLWQDDAPADAAFFTVRPHELEKSRQVKSTILPVLKKKGAGKFPYAATAVRRGSYESAGIGGNASGALTAVQMSSLVSNLNMLEQVGSSEMNLIFARSQKLNSKAIVDFIKALCKVSMEELHSASDPRVFSLTKIIEIAHYNMNRIRLVWSSIWHVLSEFFVNIGCSENLSIAIFVIDSLRQLSMKFIEREELANYNFQNEFMKPFVIVMDKSTAVEIRELIIRCVSQMVLSRVSNVNSGWKSLFMVLTTAAYDDHKNIVLLAFEMIEKVVRDYFSYITETETTIFIECVNCLIAFAYSRLNKDISLNAIDFLRVCAEKLAEGDHDTLSKKKDIKISGGTSPLRFQSGNDRKQDSGELIRKDDRLYFWPPLLAGLSELSFGSKPEIRKIALQVLFDSLRNYGRLFSLSLWERVFELVLFPIFDHVQAIDHSGDNSPAQGSDDEVGELDQDAWLCETSTLALQLIVDLFVNFYDIVNPLLRKVLMLLVSFISRPDQSLAGIGIAAFVRLISNAGDLFSNEKWLEVVSSLKEAANATLPDFSCVMDGDEMSGRDEDSLSRESGRGSTGSAMDNDGSDSHGVHPLYAAISDSKCRASVQLLLIQAMMEIYNLYRPRLSAENAVALIDALHTVALHAHNINSNTELRSKLQDLGSMTQMQDPPLLRLENESYQMCLTLLQNLLEDSHSPPSSEVECDLVNLCQEVLRFYIDSASTGKIFRPSLRWSIPMGSGKRRELAARAPLVVATLQALCGLEMPSFEKHLYRVYPLIPSLISCEHGSKEVPAALCEMLSTSVGPLLLRTS